MNIPGDDLLDVALSVLNSQTVQYFAFTGTSTGANLLKVSAFVAPVEIETSFQPVPRNMYQALGLDFSKSYFTFFASVNVIPLERDIAGDQVTFNGRRYQCQSSTPWFGVDGWTEVQVIDIGPA